ncbi:hypothetical protein ACP275_04G209700 [Erythranthe tilingii]
MSRRSSTTPSKSASQPKPTPSAFSFFTEKDEIDLLESLATPAAAPPRAYPFRRQFTESQIANKTRRLRQNYNKLARSKSFIKTPHHRRIYEIGNKIWGKEKTIVPPPPSAARKRRAAGGEEEINWNDYPFLMNAVSGVFRGTMNLYKEGLKALGKDIVKGLDNRWKEIAIEEAALHAEKLDLYCKTFKSERFNSKK